MARVTIEDCLENHGNRFSLVHLVASRVRQLHEGSRSLVRCDNKDIVKALREVAAGKIKVMEVYQEPEEELNLKIDIPDLL